jgi:hypothetical protein
MSTYVFEIRLGQNVNKTLYTQYIHKYLRYLSVSSLKIPLLNISNVDQTFSIGAVFLRKTQISIVSIYEYTVYIMF